MTSITEIAYQASRGSDTAVTLLWTKCGGKLIEKARQVISQFGIASTNPEEVASAVFAQCVMWSQDSSSYFENRRKFWSLLSLATFLYGRRVHRHDKVAKRPPIWEAEELQDTAARFDEVEQLDLWEEYEHLLKCHPQAAVVFPMLIDRQPIEVIAGKLNTSVRSAYRLVAELRKDLAERLYE